MKKFSEWLEKYNEGSYIDNWRYPRYYPKGPFDITSERAKEIWQTRDTGQDASANCTKEEKDYIKEIWKQMPDECSWLDALFLVYHQGRKKEDNR